MSYEAIILSLESFFFFFCKGFDSSRTADSTRVPNSLDSLFQRLLFSLSFWNHYLAIML